MRIWILNHYATDMYFDKAGRHHSLSKYLIREGHEVKIFCANTVHNSELIVDTGADLFMEKTGEDDVPYVFVKTRTYRGNGRDRILNMFDFTFRIKRVLKKYVNKEEKPDVILASSVHPLTLVAGIRFAKKIGIPCICEVRDLWPETFLDFGFSSSNVLLKVLYRIEKWIYVHADKLIFTMEGGKDYIMEKGWENTVDLSKIAHINNGVDLELFQESKEKNRLEDTDLNDETSFKIIYAGSVREANGVRNIVDCAAMLKGEQIKFLVFGDGPEKQELEDYCVAEGIANIVFKGKVDKRYIPYILSKGDLLLLNYKTCKVDRFGTSQNKLFEYFASGKPIISNVAMGYDIIKKYGCGISKAFRDQQEYAEAILSIRNTTSQEYKNLCQRSQNASRQYDYRNLSRELEQLVQSLAANRDY